MGQKDLNALAKADVKCANKFVGNATKYCAFHCEFMPLCPPPSN